jgi:DNA polymerase-3 subunit delta
MGDEQFLHQLFVRELEKALFREGPPDKTVLLPDEMDGREIIDRLTSTDLFSSRKLFILHNPHQLRDPYRRELLDYCDHPIPTHCLVIIVVNYQDRRKIVKELSQRLEAIDVRTPFESELRRWAAFFFREQGLNTDAAAIRAVVDIAGDSIYHVANEIEKIAIILEEGEELTVAKIRQFAGWHRDRQRWEFLLAIGNKDLSSAVKLGKALITQNDTMLSLLYPLTTLFQEMYFLKLDEGTSKTTNSYISLSPAIKKRLPQFAKRYSKQELETALHLLGEIDERIKTVSVDDESEISRFLFTLLGGHG